VIFIPHIITCDLISVASSPGAVRHGVAGYNFYSYMGLIKNHPFVDGNKRIGFAVAALFLQLNGWRLEAGQADAVVQTLGLAAGAIDEVKYATWLTANSRQRL